MSVRVGWIILLGFSVTLLVGMYWKGLPAFQIFPMLSTKATSQRSNDKDKAIETDLPNGTNPAGSEDTFTAWKAKQDERKKLLRGVCTAHGDPPLTKEQEINTILNNKQMLNHLLASEHQQVIYCPIAKVACSSWKLLFLQMSPVFNWNQSRRHRVHDPGVLEKHGLKSLGKYNSSDVRYMLESFPKFLIVRHPYARLHSAFIEKLTFRRGQWNKVYTTFYGRRIMEAYWRNPSEESLRTGYNVSFADFLHFISDKEHKLGTRGDPHWAPFYRYCFPCQVTYDYILKLETIGEDSEQLLGNVFNTSLRLKSLNIAGQTNISAYDDVPRPYLNDLFDAYKLDFELFGYN